jgi:hypothetical protein
MVNNLVILSVPEALKNETNSTINDKFVYYNASDALLIDPSKLGLPLVLVFLQCLVLAFIYFKNTEEEDNIRMEAVQHKLLDESIRGGLNLLEVGLNYGTFSQVELKRQSSSAL